MAKQEKKVKKLTEQELLKLKQIKEHYQTVKDEFGEISLLELNLNSRKLKAQEYFEELKNSEANLTKSLLEKYGAGNINIQTGEIS
tara:strand:- start:1782 stop:2039 length:258 start_codon:yes stop_codon:yes gene_type:complete